MNQTGIYSHLSPGRLVFGPDSVRELPNLIGGDKHFLIVTDPGVVRTGTASKVADILMNAGIGFEMFEGVFAEPTIDMVEEAVELCRHKNVSGIIGLGGGSALDAAKATAVRLSAPGTLREYGDGKTVESELIPLYAIPTTAGTGSEVTRVAVITDMSSMEKMSIRGPHLAPRAAVLDPRLLATVPPRIAAETGADALTHAVEAYVSLNANPITDILAIGAVKLIAAHLESMVANPADPVAAEGMLLGSCLAGQAFSNASVGLAHSLGEPVGAYCHVGHGLACALYLPVVMEFNRLAVPNKFGDLALALGRDTSDLDIDEAAGASVDAVRILFKKIGLPLTFKEAGVQFTLDHKMIDDVWPQFSTRCNPRKPSTADVERLYRSPLK